MPKPELAIVGAGPLGLATALMLHRQGHAVRIFDARAASAPITEARVLALSHGSRQVLQCLDAWPAERVTPIETIHVSQQGAWGRTLMRASEHALPALGYVLPAKDLIIRLRERVDALGIPLEFDAPVKHTQARAADILLTVGTPNGGDREATAAVVLCCEGSVQAGSKHLARDYHQHALLCRAQIAHPHAQLAYERFTADGPLALLPLGKDYAVVWTRPTEDAQRLMQADDGVWLAALQAAFGQRVCLTGITERASYPLALKMRLNPVAARTVWLGNAAQTLHPVAGQGLNLALRDAWELCEHLRGAADPGAEALLRGYARGRSLDRFAAAGFSDALVRTFGTRLPLLPLVRGLGLAALDAAPPLRRFLARRMIFGARAWP